MSWIVMPVRNNWSMTEQALYDCLGQTVEPRVLVVAQGVDEALRRSLEKLSEKFPERLFCWFNEPPIPSLSGVWNRALQFVWQCGGEEALVVNNDVRLDPKTYELLDGVMRHTSALFVSAVGVTEEQWNVRGALDPVLLTPPDASGLGHPLSPGGPDFSCFLLSRSGHWKYAFDEHFIPAFCEDLDTHRRYMLGGDGERIFSVNVPYLHYASQTLKTLDPKAKAATEAEIAKVSRAYYQKKWGGPVNGERFLIPFDPTSTWTVEKAETKEGPFYPYMGPTTPELQAYVLGTRTSTPVEADARD